MSKSIKIWMLVAGILVATGLLSSVVIMTVIKWDISELNTSKCQTNVHEIEKPFENISVVTKTADVKILPSEDGTCRVVAYEQKNMTHRVSVESGNLQIVLEDERAWFDHIGIVWDRPSVTVYLPQAEYAVLSIKGESSDVEISQAFCFASIDVTNITGDVNSRASATGHVSIQTNTGDIFVKNAEAGSIELLVSTGSISMESVQCQGEILSTIRTGETNMKNVTCASLVSNGTVGDVELKNVIAGGKITIERSTGDIELERSDAAELLLKNGSGDVEGSLLSEKTFLADSKTGDIKVPKNTVGGVCKITTTTGDIEFRIVGT